MRTRRNQAINDTKIKYISVGNKVYEVTGIQWLHSYIEAKETDLNIDDVPESEIWNIEEFKNYKVKLINNGGQAEVIDFNEWKDKKDGR